MQKIIITVIKRKTSKRNNEKSSIIKKINGCKNNPENSFTTKVRKHIPLGLSMSAISLLRSKENKHDVNRGKNCMKKFCEFLRKHSMNFKKKKWSCQQKSSKNHTKMQTSVICVKKYLKKYIWKIKNIAKVEVINIIFQNIEDIENIENRDIENIADSICSLKYSTPKNIPIIFCNESNYDYHFIVNELPKEFKKEFTC